MADKPSQPAVGGQAVIEGVMMRSPNSFAVVCRRTQGEIVIREQRWHSIWDRWRFLKWPFFRGGVVLVEAMINGMSALTFSAQQQELEGAKEEEEESEEPAPSAEKQQQNPQKPNAEEQKPKPEKPSIEKQEQALSPAAMTGLVLTSIAMALVLFVGLPHLLTWLIGLNTDTLSFHLTDGVIKICILVGYIGAIGLNKEIRRVFMYHGAEHKSIWAHEKELELTVENVRQQSRFHPRCGTSFLVVVILVSVFLFAALLQFPISSVGILDHLAKILIKIPLMFPVAGLAYEGIKLSGKHRDHFLVRFLIAPGMWLQRLTTREPSDDQLEIAILSLKKTLWREQTQQQVADSGVEVYADFAEAESHV